MDAAEQARARARAEARRQKILARQKDRLSSITGSYAEPAGMPVPAQQPSSTPQSSVTAAPTTADAPDAAQQEQQQMAELMAAVGQSLQRAQAAMNASEPSSNQQAPTAFNELLSHMAAGQQTSPAGTSTPPASRAAGTSSQSDLLDDDQLLQQQEQQGQQGTAGAGTVHLLLRLGPVLSIAVKQTQIIRLLSALMLAYAALSGWELGMPPALLVVVTNLCIVAAALALLHNSSYGRKLAAKQAAAAAGGDVQVPWRLRSFDFLSLVPGLRELLTALSGYQQLANALSEDSAAFLVTMGLLTVTLALQPPLVKV